MNDFVFLPMRCPAWGNDTLASIRDKEEVPFDVEKWVKFRPVKRYTNLAGSLKSVIENGPMLSSHDQTYLKCFSNNNLKTSALKVVVKRTVQDVKGTKWYCSNSERKAIWNKAVEAILENLTRSEPHCSYLTECLKPVLPSLIPNGKFRPLSNLMTVEVKYDVQPRPVQKLPSTTSTLHFDLAVLQDSLNRLFCSVHPVQNLLVNPNNVSCFSSPVCSMSSATPFSDYQFQCDQNPFSTMIMASSLVQLSQAGVQNVQAVISACFGSTLKIRMKYKQMIDQGTENLHDTKIFREIEVVRQPLSKLIARTSALKAQLQTVRYEEEFKDKKGVDITCQFSKEESCIHPNWFPVLVKGPLSSKVNIRQNLSKFIPQKYRETQTPSYSLDSFRNSEKIFALGYSCSESIEILSRSRQRFSSAPRQSLPRLIKQALSKAKRISDFIASVPFERKQKEIYGYLLNSLNIICSKLPFRYTLTVIKESKLRTLIPRVLPASLTFHEKIGRQHLFKFDPPRRETDSIIYQTIAPSSFVPSADNLHILELDLENTKNDVGTRSTQNRFGFLNLFPDDDEENIDFEMFVKNSPTASPLVRSSHHPGENTALNPALIGLQIPEANERPLTVAVPESMNCCSWSSRVAEHCLAVSRVFLLSPPLLNVLPSLVIIAQSYLSRPHRDDRVAIVCDGDPSDVRHVHSFFKSCLEDSVSIKVVESKSDTPPMYSGADASGVTARVVIVDSFTTQMGDGFSLLLIIVSVPSLMKVRGAPRTSQRLRILDAARWRSIPSIVIAPGNTWTGLQAFSERITEFTKKLNVTRVIQLTDCDDIALAMELARPAIACVEPTADEKSLCFFLEKIGQQYLHTYNKVVNRENCGKFLLNSVNTSEAISIHDVSTEFLKTYISQLIYWDEECEELARIYNIKQLQTYAVHDGVETAIEFLEECKRSHPSRRDIWDQIMATVQSFDPSERISSRATDHSDDMRLSFATSTSTVRKNGETGEIPGGYRMANILHKLACRAKKRMLTEAPFLRDIHRREHFQLLIVTDSSEARDQLRQAVCLGELSDGNIVVYKWDELCSSQSNMKNDSLEGFSHVFHVTDDRHDAVPSNRLPCLLLQCIFSGRTNLTTVSVDLSGTMCNLWKENERAYKRLERKTSVQPAEERKISFIVETDVEIVQSLLKVETNGDAKNSKDDILQTAK